MALDFESMSPEDLAALKDMFGEQSPALKEQLQASRQAALEQTLGKPLSEDIVRSQSIPGKTAASSAQTFKEAGFAPVSAEEIISSQSIPGKTAAESAKVFEGMPRTAAESAQTFEEAGLKPQTPTSEPITNLPSSRVFEAREKLAQAARGTVGEGVIAAPAPERSTLSALMENPRLAAIISKMKGAGSTIAESPLVKAGSKYLGPAGEGLMFSELVQDIGQSSPSDSKAERERITALALQDMYKRQGSTPPTPSGGLPTPAEFRPGVSSIPADAKLQGDVSPSVVPAAAPEKKEEGEEEDQEEPSEISPVTPSVSKTAPVEQKIPEAQAAISKEPSMSDRYKEMMDRVQNITMMNQLAKAAAQVGSGIPAVTGVKGMVKPTTVDTKLFDENIALAQRLPEQFKQQLEMEHKDPKSEDSIAARKFLKSSLNVDIPDNISAAQLKEQFPVIERMLATRENVAARKEIAKQHAETIQVQREALKQQKEERNTEKDLMTLSQKLEGGVASSRSVLGRSENTIRGARAIQALADQFDPNNLTPQEISEIARNLDSMLSQGQATVSGTKKLIPLTFQGDVSKISSYISGLPKGAQQGEFVKRMLNTVKREAEVAAQTKKEIQDRITAGYTHLKEKAPERYNALLMKHGLGENVEVEAKKIKAVGQHPPGTIVILKNKPGKRYKVGADGDTLEEI